jgi:hypothetical protein
MLRGNLHAHPDVCQSPRPAGRHARIGRRAGDVAALEHIPHEWSKAPAIRQERAQQDLRCNSVNDDQPTVSFPRLPYPSAADRLADTEPTPAETPEPEPPPAGWRARRRAARARAAAESAMTGTPSAGPASAPQPPAQVPGPITDVGADLPGPMDVPASLASSTRGLRRQRRRLLNQRDRMVFHLGGLAYELHLLGELSTPVAERRAGMISALDTTVRAIDAQLAARGSTTQSEQRLPIVVGSCRTCHTLFVAEARYCMNCGAVLTPAEDREPTP